MYPFGVTHAPVQRKVGFEIEVKGPLIGQARRTTSPANPEDQDPNEYPGPLRVLSKGEVLHQGAGWKLTPDGAGTIWTPEYIIAAIDETQNPEQIPIKMEAVADHAQTDLMIPWNWGGDKGKGLRMDMNEEGDEVLGSFHVTGGLRLSRISQLIKTLYPDNQSSVGLVNRAEGISLSGSNYKSVVALLATQILDLVSGGGVDGHSAKRNVSILSRTDLGQVVAKVTGFTRSLRKETFINEVLTTAGINGNTRLFSHQLPGSAGTTRSIDDQQNLTARQWLEKLLTGTDFKWSETKNDSGENFGFEKVGEEGTFGHRADGIILELRAVEEQSKNVLPPSKWIDVANRYKTLFALLNRKAPEQSVKQGFGSYESNYDRQKADPYSSFED